MSIITYNDITGDFELGSTSTVRDKFTAKPLDYLILIIGARDYRYIMDNNHILDNEVTSLYPIISYPILQFILFMMSFKNDYIRHIFNFRKDRIHGIYSDFFFKCINSMYKEYPIPKPTGFRNIILDTRFNKGFRFYHDDTIMNMVYNFSNRPFTFLTLPLKFVLSPVVNCTKQGDPRYIKLFCKNTNVLTWQKYASKLRLNFKDLEFAFKNDVLEFLPRFYFNRYNQYHDIMIKKGTAGIIKNSTDMLLTREDQMNFMTRTDLYKKNINIEINKELADGYVLQKKTLDKKLGIKTDVEEIKQRLFHKLKEEKYKRIKAVDELDEFYIKSIIIRRSPRARINTYLNSTNGIYLLHNGVARFKELLFMEMLYHRKKINNNNIKMSDRSFKIYDGKTTNITPSEIIDLDNRPYLLSNKIMKLVDSMYRYELHGLLKYAEIYARFFNYLGNDVMYFILGTELANYTGFKFERYLEKKGKGWGTFINFEFLLERPARIDHIFKRLRHAQIYTHKKEAQVRKKFLLGPPVKHY